MRDEPSQPINQRGPAGPLWQFGIADLLCLTFVMALAATYLRGHAWQPYAWSPLSLLLTVFLASVVGAWRGQWLAALFWGVLLTAMVQVMVSEVILLHPAGVVVWPVAAGLAAALVASDPRWQLHRPALTPRVVQAVWAVGVPITTYAAIVARPFSLAIPNIVSAVLGAIGLAIVVTVCQWLDASDRLRQSYAATALATLAIAVAWLEYLT
ncbi:hypothetical protein [Roseimaritima sediminicola]|uniref:hypothetical protein n=1 Tax=Roseimaritima sediminicola TaxID=2662066 RepID=UPI00129834E2|nr:hypothetical protein [Roseimaritima sediminicola]